MENSRESTVLAADLPDFAEIESRDPSRASELVSRFHQVLGECVYAYGGSLHDTMASIAIAELPEPADALRCIESLQKRIRTGLDSTEKLAPRAVLTSGEVHDKDFSIAGHAVQNALSILDSLAKDQMLVSSTVLERAGVATSGAPLLRLGETGYFALPLSSPAPAATRTTPQMRETGPTATLDEDAGETVASPGASRRPPTAMMAVIGILVLLAVAAALVFFMRSDEPAATVTQNEAPAPAPAAGPSVVALSIGDVEIAPDAQTAAAPARVATALMNALLRSADDVEISAVAPNSVGADVRMIVPSAVPDDGPVPAGAQVSPGPGTSAQPAVPHVIPWIERSGERFEGPPTELGDVWTIVIPTVRWAGEQLGFETTLLIPQSEDLRDAFAAVVQSTAPGAGDDDLAALHAALAAEPEFLPGWLILSRVEGAGERLAPLILDGLRNVSRIMPAKEDLARQLGRRELSDGTLAGAVEAFSRVRNQVPRDPEAHRVLALAALAAHDVERFRNLAKSGDQRLHPADLEVAEGKINEAVKQYYETESMVPDNPYLAFKIGRIAVLRRSSQIATIEMDKLEQQGVEPQKSFLRAFIAADDGDRAGATAALDEAMKSATWADSPSFHAAEIHAILRNAPKTLAALERAVDRREPMMHAIATNPLFGYLKNEPRFRDIVSRLLEHQRTIGASLAEHS